MDTLEAFAAAVRARRHELGLSQEQLASAADLHHTYISMIERSKRDPRLDTLLKLARGLRLTAGELVTRAHDLEAPDAPRRRNRKHS